MRLLQVTIGAGTRTQVTPNTNTGFSLGIFCTTITFQNNAANNCVVGDSTVTTTRGIVLNPTGANTISVNTIRGSMLSQYYLAGTAGDVIDVLYETSE